MIRLLFFTYLFFYSSIAFTQEYYSGTIILNNSDTLKGMFKVSTNDGLSSLKFKNDSIDRDIEYKPENVKKFFLNNGEIFESYPIVEGEQKNYDFFRCIIQGTVSLYSRYDQLLTEHLYLKTVDGQLMELIEKKVITDDPSSNSHNLEERTYPLYYRVLGYAYVKCPRLLDPNKLIKLNKKSIEKSVIDYHQCINESYTKYSVEKNDKSSIPIQYGLYFGKVYTNKVYYGGYYSWSTKEISSDYTKGYNAGGFINFFLRNSNQSKSIQCEVIYSNYSFTNDKKVEYSRYTVSFRSLIKLYLHENKNSFYFGLGSQLYNINNYKQDDYVEVYSPVFTNLGYSYNLGKCKVFADFRLDFFFDKIYTVNLGLAFNSKNKKAPSQVESK